MSENPAKLQALIAALLAAATAFLGIVQFTPLGSPRPVAQQRLSSEIGEQDVVARLWEDPFSAVRVAAKEHKADDDTHSVGGFRKALLLRLQDKKYPHVRVMAVFVPGTPFAEDAELRLRMRQALQVTMLEHRLRPHDRNHLGFVKLDWPRELDAVGHAKPGVGGPTRIAWQGPGKSFEIIFRLPAAGPAPASHSLLVPYEWFKTEPSGSGVDGNAIVVLWMPEEAFADQPLPRLRHLLANLLPKDACTNQVELAVIGPRSSDTLRRMAKETGAAESSVNRLPALKALRVYSATATAPDAFLYLEPFSGRNGTAELMHVALRRVFPGLEENGLTFRNLTLTDEVLAALLVQELELRGIQARERSHNHHRIVLISESDTFYGRALPAAFMAATRSPELTLPQRVIKIAAGLDVPPHILAFSHLRGLDGRSARAARSSSDKPDKSSGEEAAVRQALRRESETAAGESQMDYLERLARRLKEQDRALRHDSRPFNVGGIRAIGVLGSDPYDKLRIIQTLRAHLPEAVFFTTDLDARLWDAENLPFTRNLIIASGFGLEPWTSPTYRGESWTSPPPFRDAYQSATHVAISSALEEWELHAPAATEADAEVDPWPGHGVFEVGRHGPVALPLSKCQNEILHCVNCPDATAAECDPQPEGGGVGAWIARCRPLGCLPGVGRLGGWEVAGLVMAVVGACGLYCCWRWGIGQALPVSEDPWSRLMDWLRSRLPGAGPAARWIRRAKRWFTWPEDPQDLVIRDWQGPEGGERRWPWLAAIERRGRWIWLIAGIVLLLTLVGIASWNAGQPGGEPFAWHAGVSVWPTEIIRAAMVWLSVGILVWAWLHHRQHRMDLWDNYFMPDSLKDPGGTKQSELEERSPAASTTVSATAQFWKYMDRARMGPRYGRILCWTACYLFFGFGLFFFLGTPARPYRGPWADNVDLHLLRLSVISLVVVTFYVLDATSMTRRLLEPLAGKLTRWPRWVIRAKADELGLADGKAATDKDADELASPLEGYLDVRLAAQQTRELGIRFYLPFGLLLLMIISRNRMFDQWPWTVPLIAIHLTSLALVFCCATMLRRTARRVRDAAIEHLDRLREQARHGLRDRLDAKSLGMIRNRILKERAGAYANFIQDPAVIALLIPTGGYGLFILLFQYVLRGG